MKLVSVIMTCLNGEKYLHEALNSLFHQTYSNWELIFVNNNSDDNSGKILLSYKDHRIKYFQTDKTLNLGTVRNFAFSKCKGEFITFLDVDDIWLKMKLEKQIKKFDTKNEIDVLYTNYCKKDQNKIIKVKKNLSNGFCQKEIILSYINGVPLTAWLTLMIKKKNIDNQKYAFDENLHISSDFDLIIRLSENSYFDYLEDYLCEYRVHSTNESKNKKKEISELDYIIAKHKKNYKLKKIFSTNLFSLKIKIKHIFSFLLYR